MSVSPRSGIDVRGNRASAGHRLITDRMDSASYVAFFLLAAAKACSKFASSSAVKASSGYHQLHTRQAPSQLAFDDLTVSFSSATFFLTGSTLIVKNDSGVLTGKTPLGFGGGACWVEYAPLPSHESRVHIHTDAPVKGSPPHPPPLDKAPLDPVYRVAPVYGSTYAFDEPWPNGTPSVFFSINATIWSIYEIGTSCLTAQLCAAMNGFSIE